ncbi:MAG: heavy-metal-associated domain-containing protein [Frankiaceae bacterium]|nr:heavy-metal-associated domain-containing protein [Frankiaceae bacterium]
MTIRTYSVPEISCGHCVEAITGEVTKLAGVTDVTVDLASKTVAVTGAEIDDAAVAAAVDDAGYTVVS